MRPSKQKKTLFASPWIGELGWQLFCWQGYLRKLAKDYDKVIVTCRTGEDLLYRDFADVIIHYDPKKNETDMWKNYGESHPHRFHQYYTDGQQGVTVLENNNFPSCWWSTEHWSKQQEFIQYGTEKVCGIRFDILMIVRDTTKCNTSFRNWPIQHANECVRKWREEGLTIACVGKSDSALHIVGTEDWRDTPLETLADIMNRSGVIVGPQCGPIHFATLCGLPQVCWQTKPEHATRVEKHWNPFKVMTSTIPSDISYWKSRIMWLPPVRTVVNEVIAMYHRSKKV